MQLTAMSISTPTAHIIGKMVFDGRLQYGQLADSDNLLITSIKGT